MELQNLKTAAVCRGPWIKNPQSCCWTGPLMDSIPRWGFSYPFPFLGGGWPHSTVPGTSAVRDFNNSVALYNNALSWLYLPWQSPRLLNSAHVSAILFSFGFHFKEGSVFKIPCLVYLLDGSFYPSFRWYLNHDSESSLTALAEVVKDFPSSPPWRS